MRKAVEQLSGALFAASITAWVPVSAQPSAPPALMEFVEVCKGIDDFDEVVSAARTTGWDAVENEDVGFLARRIGDFDTSAFAIIGAQRPSIAGFRKVMGDETLFLLVEDHRFPDGSRLARLNTCEVFDLTAPPSYADAVQVFGERHSIHDEDYPPATDPTSSLGISWYDEFGLEGASDTRISMWEDTEQGPYVSYSATWRLWNRPSGNAPSIPPPPRPTIVSTPKSTPTNSSNQ